MAEVDWTDNALSNLNDIAEYIAVDNLDAAKLHVQRVFDSTERLAMFPESGRKPPELLDLEYREVVVEPCRVFYKIEQDKVSILFVMRVERDLRRYVINSLND